MLEARGITFTYPGKTPIYQGLNFSIEPGERVAVKGAIQIKLAAAGSAIPEHGHSH